MNLPRWLLIPLFLIVGCWYSFLEWLGFGRDEE